MRYVAASTDNPFGRRPWQTSLYTTFGNFGWLKQPQNIIARETLAIRPMIRKPPEFALRNLAGIRREGGTFLGFSDPSTLNWLMSISPALRAKVQSGLRPAYDAPQVDLTQVALTAPPPTMMAPAATAVPVAAVTPPAAPAITDQLNAWLQSETFGIKNLWLVVGAAGLFVLYRQQQRGGYGR